jgi:hypothetical protein
VTLFWHPVFSPLKEQLYSRQVWKLLEDWDLRTWEVKGEGRKYKGNNRERDALAECGKPGKDWNVNKGKKGRDWRAPKKKGLKGGAHGWGEGQFPSLHLFTNPTQMPSLPPSESQPVLRLLGNLTLAKEEYLLPSFLPIQYLLRGKSAAVQWDPLYTTQIEFEHTRTLVW